MWCNTQIGITSHGGHNILVRDNNIHRNRSQVSDSGKCLNRANTEISQHWEGGATKFKWTTNLRFINNRVHDGYGSGIWLDIDNFGAIVRNNTVTNNQYGSGIYQEAGWLPVDQSTLPAKLSQGAPYAYSALIENNTVNGCGRVDNRGFPWEAGLQVAASTDVIVRNNTVNNCFAGVSIVSQDRLDTPSLVSQVSGQNGYSVRRVTFSNNRVFGSNIITAFDDNGDSAMYGPSGVRFTNNTTDQATVFHWNGQRPGSLAGWVRR